MASLKDLSRKKGIELSSLYSSGVPVEIPNGESNGTAIIAAGTAFGVLLSWMANCVWKGKVFTRTSSSTASLVNKILGMRIVHAEVSEGLSWSDGKKAIIIDYLRTSLIAFYIRDEIRMLEPGLYLGKAYIRLPFGYRFCALYFALDFRKV